MEVKDHRECHGGLGVLVVLFKIQSSAHCLALKAQTARKVVEGK